ncbi:methyltransferase domain-containing protein [Persicimonas caeni]|nr:methyltransferase domain-containing protein [Persicimonas caeni]
MAKKASKQTIEELSQVKYVGPAKAEAFVKELGIGSIEELYEASKNGKLEKVSGVGAALSKKIHKAAGEALKATGPAEVAEEPAKKAKEAQKKAKEKKAKEKQEAKAKEAKAKAAEKEAEAKKEAKAKEAKAKEEAKAKAVETKKKAEKKAKEVKEKVEKKAKETVTEEVPPTPETARKRAPAKPAARTEDRVEQFIATLRCPACGHDEFDRGATTLTCTACRREYNFHNGVADLAPPKPSGRSVTQRIMESRFYARFYEDVMRPKLTGVVSDRSLSEEYALSSEMLELDDNTRLLDVAAGTGNFTRYFAQQLNEQGAGDDSLVVGMDLSWPMLETARTYLRRDGLDEQVFLIRGDATRIPARRAAYNRLHCAGALHMMKNIDEALRNFARILEPGGICVIGTFILGDGMMRRLVKRAAELPTQFHWFSRDELHQRLRRAGFEVVEDSVAGDAITVKTRRT